MYTISDIFSRYDMMLGLLPKYVVLFMSACLCISVLALALIYIGEFHSIQKDVVGHSVYMIVMIYGILFCVIMGKHFFKRLLTS